MSTPSSFRLDRLRARRSRDGCSLRYLSLKKFWLYIGSSNLRRTGLSSSLMELLGLQAIRLDHITDFLCSLRIVRSKHIAAIFSNVFGREPNSISGFCAMLLQRCDNDTLEGITLCKQSYNTFCNVYVHQATLASSSQFNPFRYRGSMYHLDLRWRTKRAGKSMAEAQPFRLSMCCLPSMGWSMCLGFALN